MPSSTLFVIQYIIQLASHELLPNLLTFEVKYFSELYFCLRNNLVNSYLKLSVLHSKPIINKIIKIASAIETFSLGHLLLILP